MQCNFLNKKISVKIGGCCLVLLLSFLMLVSCDFDPYVGKRPIDYEASCWISEGENYYIYYDTDSWENSYIEIDGEKKYSFCFLWSALDNRVNAYQDGNSGYADERLFVGECEFGRNSFEMDIVEYYDDTLKALPEQLKFVRE